MFRSLLVTVLLLALIPAAALGNASVWASRTVLDSATFSTTVGRALDTPAAERALAERLAEELFALLIRTDERVRIVLGPLVGAGLTASDEEIVAGLRPSIQAALGDPRIEAARDELVAAIHEAFLRGVGGDGSVRLEGDRLVLDVRDLLRAVLDALDPRLRSLAPTIPATATTEIVLASAPGLAATSDGLSALERLGIAVPLLAIALGLLAIVLARRRNRALAGIGVAVAMAGGAGLLLVALGGLTVGGAESAIDPVLDSSTYGALSDDLVTQSLGLATAGGVLVAFAGVAGMLPSRRSRRGAGSTEPW